MLTRYACNMHHGECHAKQYTVLVHDCKSRLGLMSMMLPWVLTTGVMGRAMHWEGQKLEDHATWYIL